MLENLEMYKITAHSKEGHGYIVELCCNPNKIQENFKSHINKIGWSNYEYNITSWETVKSEHIEIDYDSTNL